LIFASILVGISAGIAAVILKTFVHLIRQYVVEDNLLLFTFKYLYLLLPLIGIGITILIVNRFFKGDIGGGNVNILHAIAKKGSFLPFHQIYSHIITSGITVGFGGSAGLESPIVSTGAAIGSNFSRVNKLNFKDRTLLLAAGVAGGIAGAFNAPIAGILFALEVILIDISISAFIPLLIAAASGALISKIILQEHILLYFRLQQPFNYYNVPLYIVLGVMAGFLSLYYVNIFSKVESKFHNSKSKLYKWLAGGISLTILIAIFPSLFGEGYESIKSLADVEPNDFLKQSILSEFISSKWVVLILITLTMFLKAFATGITVGSGGNGGNFAPSLFVGAYLGFIFSYFLQLVGMINTPISNFTIVAMAGILSGVFHAPLTAIFLIAEITGGYELIIPLMIVSSISFIIVKKFHPDSMDAKKLKAKGAIVSEDKDTSILSRIDIPSLIDHDFAVLHPEDKLREVIQQIKHTRRNTFAVVDNDYKLIGLIQLNSIREEMFNSDLYDKIVVNEIMEKASVKIERGDDVFLVMKKFDASGQWNLPIVDQGVYLGFISKSSILTKYRNELLLFL
ncbi:MAG TPA: chloride channel protein, partial [Bacteroidia bacterium]|nr:chloride channel protein [Bacteroidia bacterium]